MNMQRTFLTMNGSINWHIRLQHSMCFPNSAQVYNEKFQMYVGKIDVLKIKLIAGSIKCQKNDFSSFKLLNKFLSKDYEVEDATETTELVLEH